MNKKKHSWLKAFRYAWNGIGEAFISERNMKVHVCLAIIVFLLAYLYEFSQLEVILLVVAVMSVLVAEMINTALEKVVDFISPEFHEEARKIKDLAAGAVLIAALSALVIGYLLFFDKIFK